MQVFNLPYQILGHKYMKRQLTGSLRYHGKTGEKKVRGGMKRVSDSLTLLAKGKPGDCVMGLPPAVVRCPEVAAARARGDIEVIELDSAATKAQRAESEKVAQAAKSLADARKAAADAKLKARMAPPRSAARTKNSTVGKRRRASSKAGE
jgi:hypothetical protein